MRLESSFSCSFSGGEGFELDVTASMICSWICFLRDSEKILDRRSRSMAIRPSPRGEIIVRRLVIFTYGQDEVATCHLCLYSHVRLLNIHESNILRIARRWNFPGFFHRKDLELVIF